MNKLGLKMSLVELHESLKKESVKKMFPLYMPGISDSLVSEDLVPKLVEYSDLSLFYTVLSRHFGTKVRPCAFFMAKFKKSITPMIQSISTLMSTAL